MEMTYREILYLVQKEALIKWSLEFVDDFCLRFLWQPEYKPLSKVARIAFLKDITN